MKAYFITFRSITLAQRGERVLRGSGFECVLQRTPRWMEVRGCGYCLRLKSADVRRVLQLLQKEKVPYSKVYSQEDGGEVEELES